MSDQIPPPPPPGNYPRQGGQPFPPPGGQPYYGQPPKKSNTLRNVLIAVIVLMILMCGGCFAIVGFGANEAAKEVDKAVSEATKDLNVDPTTQDQPDAPGKSDDPSPAEEVDEPEPKAEWKTVAKLSGNTNKSGPDFHLNGCDTRLKYTVDGGDMLVVAFYVMESGTKLLEDGGIPVASPSESGPGETVIREDEGDYYLEAMAANANWSVQIQEKC